MRKRLEGRVRTWPSLYKEITMRIILMALLLQGCAPGYNTTTTGDKMIIAGALAIIAIGGSKIGVW